MMALGNSIAVAGLALAGALVVLAGVRMLKGSYERTLHARSATRLMVAGVAIIVLVLVWAVTLSILFSNGAIS